MIKKSALLIEELQKNVEIKVRNQSILTVSDSKPRRRSVWAAPEDEDFSAGSMGSLNPASRMHQQIRSMDAKNKRKYTDIDGNEKGDKLQDQKQGPTNGFVNIHCPRHDYEVNSVRYNNFKNYY